MKMTGWATGALIAAAAFAFPASSQAQVNVGDVFGGRDSRAARDARTGYGDTYRIGYDNGMADGQKSAGKDRSKSGSLSQDSKFRKGDAGYKKSYGPRQDYIAGYRDGYEQAFGRGSRAADAGAYGRGRNARRGDREDPYAYGRDGRYGRDDRNGTDPSERDGRYGTDPADPYGRDQGYGRDDRRSRDPYGDEDNQDDPVYEDAPQ